MGSYESSQLDALGHKTRRAILQRLLRRGPMPVGKLADGLPASRPAISQHLRRLKNAELVMDQTSGTRRVYQLNPEGFNLLRQYCNEFWEYLDSIKEINPEPKKKRDWWRR